MRRAVGTNAGPAGKTDIVQYGAHGPAAGAVAGGVDNRVGYIANVRPAAQEASEMSFFIAPSRDLDGTFYGRIGIDDAGGFERIDHAERPIEPARVILAFEM